jgi:hypothetical protein
MRVNRSTWVSVAAVGIVAVLGVVTSLAAPWTNEKRPVKAFS